MKDRDQVILEHILVEDKLDHANSHLGIIDPITNIQFVSPDRPWDSTDKFRVAMIIAPAWGVLFPPYNLAKLTGSLRQFDYSTKVYDLNVESYHLLNNDYWRGEKYFLWTIKENFDDKILPLVKPIFDKAIADIVEANPKVIGFSIYNTNLHATVYIVNELKRLLPDVCFIAGGPEVVTGPSLSYLPFNYLFIGEAEETLIQVLEELPNEYPIAKTIGTTDSKLNLENIAFPDYSDYNLKSYQHPDGVSIETSRGCVAQCSFCAETYFWKFRSRTPERVVEEMEQQINLYGVKRFWFVDSLVNGNLKNFEKLIDLILEKKLDIKWNSYARCDGRMTKEFIEKIAKSGCTCLSYGVESGSQKVLLDMRKKVAIWEIENNLRHGAEVKLFNHVNWIIGFPTEEPIDFLHSLQLLANARTHIGAISPGFGAGPAFASHMATDWKIYGMLGNNHVGDITFLNTWYTEGYKNTILHRFIRIKMFHVWLDILKKKANSTILNSQEYSNIDQFYTFNSYKKCNEYVNIDEFVVLNENKNNTLYDSIANEYLSIVYALYRYFGAYIFTIKFDIENDKNTFGDWLVNDYTSNFFITISGEGVYMMSLSHTFNHPTDSEFNFKKVFVKNGNINDWVSKTSQVKETVHEQYRTKKVIPITNLRSYE
jgi:radical SAM superfamily enzyme YgiQ (UPF0313 family)